MKIEKGKLYQYAGELEKCMSDGVVDDGLYSDKIVVHCINDDDKLYVAKKYNLESISEHSSNYIIINEDDACGEDYDGLRSYHIIDIQTFKEFYPGQDKFAELKEAHKNGAVIECLQSDGEWFEIEAPKWQVCCEYRIKPISKEEQKELIVELSNSEPYDDPYNWGSIIIDTDNYRNNALETEAKEAIKFEDGKLTWEVDFDFLEGIADRMQLSSKYPPYNWQKPLDYKKLLTAGFRHYVQIMKGNFEDDGQEYGHLFAVVTNLMMAYYQLKNNVNKKNEN